MRGYQGIQRERGFVCGLILIFVFFTHSEMVGWYEWMGNESSESQRDVKEEKGRGVMIKKEMHGLVCMFIVWMS